MSSIVQISPSSHAVPAGCVSWTHPPPEPGCEGSNEHESTVHELPSSQLSGSCLHVPFATSHESTVHGLKSSQGGQSTAGTGPASRAATPGPPEVALRM